MADSDALRARRRRWHKSGNHELCRGCDAQQVLSGGSDNSDGPVSAAHRAELERMGLLETSEGQVAIALAGLLDAQKGAMGAAATATRLLTLMADLRRRQPAAATPLDELRERRNRRRA